MKFPRQEYWSGLLCFPPGDLPDPDIERGLLHCRQILSIWVTRETFYMLLNKNSNHSEEHKGKSGTHLYPFPGVSTIHNLRGSIFFTRYFSIFIYTYTWISVSISKLLFTTCKQQTKWDHTWHAFLQFAFFIQLYIMSILQCQDM